MAEVTFSGPAGQIANGGAVTYEGTKPDIEDGWTPVLPSAPVRVDGGTFIPPAVAKGEPVTNDGGHATIYRNAADGRKVEPGHVSNTEVRIVGTAHADATPAQPPLSEAFVGEAPPAPVEPRANPDAQLLGQTGPAFTANTDISIGGGGTREDRQIPASRDHVAYGAVGRPVRR